MAFIGILSENLLMQHVGLVKGIDLTGLLGGYKRRLGVWGMEVPQLGPGAEPR